MSRFPKTLKTLVALAVIGTGAGTYSWMRAKSQLVADASRVPKQNMSPTPIKAYNTLFLGEASSTQTLAEGTETLEMHPIAQNNTVFMPPEELKRHVLFPNEEGQHAGPVRMTVIGDQLYFLARGALYTVPLMMTEAPDEKPSPQDVMPPGRRIASGERIRELFSMTSDGHRIWLLDKSNDLYRFTPETKSWEAEELAYPGNLQPDPHYLALDWSGGRLWLLDYARNQIWSKQPGSGHLQPYFTREIMTWQHKKGERDLSRSMDLAVDKAALVLTETGQIQSYTRQQNLQAWSDLSRIPSPYRENALKPAWRRLLLSADSVYVLDNSLRRIVELDRQTASLKRQYVLPDAVLQGARLTDLFLAKGRVYVLTDKGLISFIPKSSESVPESVQIIKARQEDQRLSGFTTPLEQALMPDNAALFPGARRLYRQGIHEGADFFDRLQPQTGGKFVAYGSPVRAIKGGQVTRTDHGFKELTPTEHQQMLAACRRQHETTRLHEDRFRGRQVWIEHEGGVTSIYAHLSSIPAHLKPGVQLAQGELIGYVGNSGTSNAVAGNRLNPHLHLEIWLSEPDDPVKGEYVGKWLSFAETRERWTRLLSGSPE